MKIKLSFLIAILSVISGGLAQAFTLPGPLVSADWLAKNMSEVQIVEVATNFDSFMNQPNKNQTSQANKRIVVDFGGHIQGSVLMDFSTVGVERVINGNRVNYLIPSPADFQKIVQSTGINKNKPIVLVPFGINFADINEALRILWQLKVYGEDNISILDGGLTGWLAEGRATLSSNVSKQKGNWVAKGYRSDLVATSEDVANASATGKTQLIDARVLPQYTGQTKSEAVRGYGHIKNAKNIPSEFLTRSANGAIYFLSRTDIAATFSTNGINASAPSISYCNTGRDAASTWFVLHEIFGNSSTKLYDGSVNLWTIENRPLIMGKN